MERRLAAVLIADVVGYSRLSQIDEEGTRARFQTDLKEVFEPKIAEHHGRLVKTMGDGILVEFHSVVDALRCAVEIQQEKEKRNAIAPSEQRLDFRIGVNLGDIIIEGEDIHGDGVNIAHRIQALAEPGGVAISATAYDHVKAKVPVGYASLGEQKVKSIAEPIRVYRVVLDPAAAGKTIRARRKLRSWRVPAAAAVVALLLAAAGAWWQPWRMAGDPPEVQNVVAADTRPSLVVLPFDNLSDDKQQGYLADGITEDLTTELARLPGLFVISRNAAFTYKGKATQPAQIATELGVRFILEGSVRRAGDQMRINAQLIDATTSGHMWAERFDGAWSEVFKLQDKMVGEIATALKLRLVTGQRASQIAGGTSNPAAYEALLRGLEHTYRDTPAAIAEAVKLYQQALALDPNFGRAWAELAWVYWDLHSPEQEQAIGIAWEDVMVKLNECLKEAAKHPSPTYHQILASLLLRQQKSDEAIAALEKGISLDASDPWNYDEMSQALAFNGRPTEARGYIDAAMRVEPGWTPWRSYVAGLAYFSMDRFEEAAASLEKIDTQPTEALGQFLWPHRAIGDLRASRPHCRYRRQQGEAEAVIDRKRR
jgi:adenylate cyclase